MNDQRTDQIIFQVPLLLTCNCFTKVFQSNSVHNCIPAEYFCGYISGQVSRQQCHFFLSLRLLAGAQEYSSLPVTCAIRTIKGTQKISNHLNAFGRAV